VEGVDEGAGRVVASTTVLVTVPLVVIAVVVVADAVVDVVVVRGTKRSGRMETPDTSTRIALTDTSAATCLEKASEYRYDAKSCADKP